MSEGMAFGNVNGNDWVDSIVTTMMGEPAYWYENPKNQPRHWKVYVATPSACNETPLFVHEANAILGLDGTDESAIYMTPTGHPA